MKEQALRTGCVEVPILEAAELGAHPSLIEDLRKFAEPSDSPYMDGLVDEALLAWGTPPE